MSVCCSSWFLTNTIITTGNGNSNWEAQQKQETRWVFCHRKFYGTAGKNEVEGAAFLPKFSYLKEATFKLKWRLEEKTKTTKKWKHCMRNNNLPDTGGQAMKDNNP